LDADDVIHAEAGPVAAILLTIVGLLRTDDLGVCPNALRARVRQYAWKAVFDPIGPAAAAAPGKDAARFLRLPPDYIGHHAGRLEVGALHVPGILAFDQARCEHLRHHRGHDRRGVGLWQHVAHR